MNETNKWKMEKIFCRYAILHLVCLEYWTTWSNKCPECNAPIPKYLLLQRDLLNEKR